MSKKYFLIVLAFNFFIASAFYISNSSAVITDISGDLANIIPICKKLDNPSLYKNDLYLGNINNVKYYTPFYVESLRYIASYTNYDYVKALNVLNFLTHFLYGVFWFYLLFLIKKDFWLAFGFSIFFRGIIWPPGMELLGISDLWTMMPRTLFSALVPLPFIIYKLTNQKIIVPAIVLGVLVNFHPISGIGAVLVYASLLCAYYFMQNELVLSKRLIEFLIIFTGIFIGMLPYFITYLSNVKSNLDIDQNLFETAIHARISEIFFDGVLFLKSWNRPYTYFFGVVFIVFYFIDSSSRKINFKIILFSILTILVFSNSLPFIEQQINHAFNLNFRVAFQLIRSQKIVIVLLQIGLFLFLYEIINKFKISSTQKIFSIAFYLLVLSCSSAPFLDKIPLIGDDISRFSLPSNLKIYPAKKIDTTPIIEVFDFVNKKTTTNDLFYCRNVYFRAATNRSEILDFHAAGMLIEGNPKTYTKAYTDLMLFNKSDLIHKIAWLKSKNVTYIIDKEQWGSLVPIYKNEQYNIYKI